MFLCYVCKQLLYPVFSVSEKHSVPIHDGEGNEGKSIVIHLSHFPVNLLSCMYLTFLVNFVLCWISTGLSTYPLVSPVIPVIFET